MAVVTTTQTITTGAAQQVFAPDAGRLDAVITNTSAVHVYLGGDNTASDQLAFLRLRQQESYRFHDSTASLWAAINPTDGATAVLSLQVTNAE